MELNKTSLKNGKTLLLRTAKKEDAKEILSYLKTIGGETNFLAFGFEGVGIDIAKEEEYITRFSVAPTSTMILAIVDEMIVGIASISADSRSRFSHNAEFGISVRKDYWNNGIGSALLEAIIIFAKKTNHIKNVHLTVIADNTRAILLYKKFGFKEVGCHKSYSFIDNKYFDAIIMDLSL